MGFHTIKSCLDCFSFCCKLVVEVNRTEYLEFKNKGLEGNFIKHSSKFIESNPKYKGKEAHLDLMYEDNFAELKKSSDGYCIMLDKETRLCTMYENRPSVCKDFKIHSKNCIKCIS